MSNVQPFPIRRCLHYVDMMQCHVRAQKPKDREAYARAIIEDYRQQMEGAGVDAGLVAQQVREFESLLIPQKPRPSGGARMQIKMAA